MHGLSRRGGRTSVLLALLAALLPVPVVAAPLTLERTFSVSDLKITRAPGMVRLALAGTSTRTSDGGAWPEMVAWLALPAGQTAGSVTVTPLDPVVVEGVDADDLGLLASRLAKVGAEPRVHQMEGMARGVPLLGVSVSPLMLDGASGRLILYRRLHVSVEPVSVAGSFPELTGRPGSPGDNRFRQALRDLVSNPEAVADLAPPLPSRRDRLAPQSFTDDAWDAGFRPTADGRPVDMVIVTGAALEEEYQRLAEWRTRSGIYTVIRTVEWIADTYPGGVDLGDRIRLFLKDAVANWGVEWVLLGGDADVVPVRLGRNQYYGGEDIPADIYYQCLDRTWNENGNQKFGEGAPPGDGTLPADNADLIPDVWLARIPCSTPLATRQMIDKTFQYERTPDLSPGYVNRFLAMAEVLEPSSWNFPDTVVFDGAVLAEEAIDDLTPWYQIDRYYENWQAFQPKNALPETRTAVIAALNDGAAIVNHAGHGFHNNLSVGIGGEELVRTDVDALTNAGKPFLFFGINCNSAALDFDSIAEHFLCQPNGAFAYLGSTRFDFPGSGDAYQEEFFTRMMAGDPVGKAHALAKLAEVPASQFDGQERWHQFSLLCLSDPAVPIYSDQPQPLVVTSPLSVPLGQPVSVSVTRLGLPLASATVTAYRAGELFATGTTDGAGTVMLECPAENPGPVSLVVTARNSLPHEGSVMLTLPGSAAWPTLRAIRVDDVLMGNGNGRLEAGETADLYLTFRNDGTGAANTLGVSIAAATTGISFPVAAATLGSLAPGATDSTWEGAPLRVTVDSGVPRVLDVESLVTLDWAGGSRTIPVGLRVGGLGLFVRSQTWVDDPGGPGSNGTVAPDELVQLTQVITNRGAARSGSVVVRLESIDPRVTLVAAEAVVGPLEPGQALPVPVPLAFRVSELAAIETIDLVVRVAGSEVSRRAVDLVAPTVPPVAFGLSRPSSILLTWHPVLDPDTRGYAVYRAPAEDGPYTLINPDVDNDMGYYEDIELPPFSRWFYRIAAVDHSGNQSGFAPTVNFATSYPTLGNWPIRREGATPSSPVVHDFDGDGTLEILIGGEEIYAVRADGTEYFDGDDDSRTLGVLTQTQDANFWTTPAVADVDADGILDIVAAGFSDGKLYVFGSDGITKPGWPRALGNAINQSGAAVPWGSPLIADLTGDGPCEIFIAGGRFLYAFHADGTEVSDGDGNPATVGPWRDLGGAFNYATPSAADFDGDGRPEIVMGTRAGNLLLIDDTGELMPGFPKNFPGGQITGSAAIADLDKDGELEMVFPVRNNAQVHAINRFGASPPGWPAPIQINQDIDASPTIADLDGDTFPDVVIVGGAGRVIIVHGQNCTLFPGFPVNLAAQEQAQSFATRGTPCLGDVTGDGVPDILVGTQTASVYGVGINGQVLPGFPLRAEDNVEGGPLLWDVDGDGHTNIVFGSVDRKVYAYDTPGIFNPTSCPWPMFRHDQMNTGYVGKALSTPARPVLSSFTAAVTPAGVQLSWRASGNEWTAWLVDRAPAGEPDHYARLTTEALPHGTGDLTFHDDGTVPGSSYRYRVSALDRTGALVSFAPLDVDVPAEAPRALAAAVSPNPFRDGTTLSYALGSAGLVTLDVFDAQGRRIRRLESIDRPAGQYSVAWDGRDDSGAPAESGVYYWRLTTTSGTVKGKLTRIP